ncbi:DksA/TraR family C4-type zinc finger protein [Arenimonas sp. GDDSR-1]|uniref:DksA/TraR family C4-type zinc finger protein n=1 Tax=Arenimonas sp. GDDSR-1 TaxID=2950125 RepID=UPI00260D5450|nr:DksA/TraR family C4-type zinc finger protein [Arenimonas sp. GDDSR-1]
MAGGWSRDGAVQDQIDASVDEAIARARAKLARGQSLTNCEECDAAIPEARRMAVPGVRLCIECQRMQDADTAHSGYNRRGSKDSQLR